MSNEQYPKLPSLYPNPASAPVSTASTLEAEPPPTPRRRWINRAGHVLLALGLLLAGVPIAWLLGIGASRLVPAPTKRMPLQEIVLRRTNRVFTEIYRLPGRWRPAPPLETRIEPIPIPTQPVEPLTTPPPALNSRERQIAEEEFAALQQEFETIRKRLYDLESKLGRAQSTADVESRLANLEQRLIPDQVDEPGAQSVSATAVAEDEPQPEENTPQENHPLLETTELKITLPSDALFAPGEARLLATAPELLNSIFGDLRQYPKATILIGSHTDDQMEPSQSMGLAFQQANALRAYLAGNLPDENRWVTIGYGQSQPITDNSNPQFRQRNRRIEIAIDRR